MTEDAVFDLASLTKPVATAASVLLLVERGRVALDAPVARYLPAFGSPDKRDITVRMLLTHTSGLPAASALSDYADPSRVVERLARLRLRFDPGRDRLYSDVGYVVLGELVERVTGTNVAEFAQANVFAPLGMRDTGFGPRDSSRVVPTERAEERMLRGVVHDPRARKMDGVAGHAGLFSTADDLGRFASALLRGGGRAGRQVWQRQTVATMWKRDGHLSHPRTLAWEIVPVWDAAARRTRATYAHSGFTGTYLWLDPERGRFMVLLASRLHPDGQGDMRKMRKALRQYASDMPASAFSPPPVSLGVDVLAESGFASLAGKRVALLTHAAAVDSEGRRTLDVLHATPRVDVVVVLAPEHGIEATAEGSIADGRDARTGLPVVALYGPRRAPPASWLDRVDVVVVDLQDAGVRFYTYLSTMLRTLRAAGEQGKQVVVLDRPNPLGGEVVEGPLPGRGADDWLHPLKVPIRHGMTLGELARLAARDEDLPEPAVVTMQGWSRAMTFDRTGLAWHAPSPNLRTPGQATLYPGVALVEATNVSVGRGTETPFELVGAPWMDARLAAGLTGKGVRGVSFAPASFRPSSGPYAGTLCHGVRIRLEGGQELEAMRLGFSLVTTLLKLYPDRFQPRGVLTLLGHRPSYEALLEGGDVADVLAMTGPEREGFRKRREGVLLY